MDIDLDLWSFLWSVVLIPIGWLVKIIFMWVKNVNEQLTAISKDNCIGELRVREILKEETDPIKEGHAEMRSDFKAVNSLIASTSQSMDNKLHSLMMNLLNRPQK